MMLILDEYKKEEKAFTLLEVLLAVFIFSIVIVMLFSSYRSVLSTTGPISKGITGIHTINNCLARINKDINSIYISIKPAYRKPGLKDDDEHPHRIVGKTTTMGDSSFSLLRFTSLAHIFMGKENRKGIAEIVYYVQETDDEKYLLKRSDNLPPYPEEFKAAEADPILCDNIKSFKILYYDDEEEEHETWDSESKKFGYATPRAIKIQLELSDSSSLFFETMIDLPVYRVKSG